MNISKTKLSYAMLNANINTGKHLAEKANVSVNTISRLLNGGSAKICTVRKLAYALNVDPLEIIEEA